MDWASLLIRLGSALPYLIAFVVVSFVLVVAIAAMVAIWHPDPRRRSAALRVLDLLLGVVRNRSR